MENENFGKYLERSSTLKILWKVFYYTKNLIVSVQLILYKSQSETDTRHFILNHQQ
jgi:hypothetical protein